MRQRYKIMAVYLLLLQKCKSQDCGIYHYKTKNGSFKSSIVIRVNNDLSDIIKVLLLFQVSLLSLNIKKLTKNQVLFQAKNKTIDHIETRNKKKCELYIEITSNSLSEWPEIRNILETLSSIDIYPKDNIEQRNLKHQGNYKLFLYYFNTCVALKFPKLFLFGFRSAKIFSINHCLKA